MKKFKKGEKEKGTGKIKKEKQKGKTGISHFLTLESSFNFSFSHCKMPT